MNFIQKMKNMPTVKQSLFYLIKETLKGKEIKNAEIDQNLYCKS